MKEYCLITFAATEHALRVEKALKEKDVPFLLIPIPREITAGCGLAVRINWPDAQRIEELINKIGITPQGVYRMQKDKDKSLLEKFSLGVKEQNR
ncbi:MAG: DUF3343 domain-containing protein [bacterium]|jgi:hypothetical protein